MLQRAASNAYSWWWASHIRTKQSKWLEQSLQDMEEKVASVMNLIQKDGDSFAKRAEMYYKHRPELIAFIEETVRAYRALAERYDKLSTDLQNANTTIASVFPDQVPYDTDYDNNYTTDRKLRKNIDPDAPKEPKASKARDAKGSTTQDHSSHSVCCLTKEEAVKEIDKLQKDILAMQTMKEFTKSSYENGLAKFWEIESNVIEMQERVCALQDEFNVTKVIEDDDARGIMADAALKSCRDSLVKLQEKHKKSSKDAIFEHERIEDVKQKLNTLKYEEHEEENNVEKKMEDEHGKIKESGPLTVTDMAETIDKLANKVIRLETSVFSKTALIEGLRMEIDDLHTQIRKLEDNKTHDLSKKLKEMEKKINGVLDLDRIVENEDNIFEMQFSEACSSLEHLSQNILKMRHDEEVKLSDSNLKQENLTTNNHDDEPTKTKITRAEVEDQTVVEIKDDIFKPENDEMNWQKMLLSGLEDKERVLLQEYTTILRKYKDAKKKQEEEEKKNQGIIFEITLQVRELKTLLAKRDNEIQKLKFLRENASENDVPLINDEDDVKVIFVDESQPVSEIEDKLRTDIDALLDENLDFWLRFGTTFHQVQKFKTQVEDLQQEIIKLKEKSTSSTSMNDLRSEIRPIYKHLKEIHNELITWLEQSTSLKTELERRCLALSNIQEEITMALKEGVEEEEIKFSTHQAVKFQGEILNMQQEHSKVNEELQAGFDHVNALHLQTKRTLGRLEEEFGLSDHNHSEMQSTNRPHVPLSSFIFGVKTKKQKPSIFACINHHKKFNVPRDGLM